MGLILCLALIIINAAEAVLTLLGVLTVTKWLGNNMKQGIK